MISPNVIADAALRKGDPPSSPADPLSRGAAQITG